MLITSQIPLGVLFHTAASIPCQCARGCSRQSRAAHLWLGDDKGAQAVVPNRTRHCQHSHDTHSVPEQDLPTRCLHPSLSMPNPLSTNADITNAAETSKTVRKRNAPQRERRESHRLILSRCLVIVSERDGCPPTTQHCPGVTCMYNKKPIKEFDFSCTARTLHGKGGIVSS